MNISLYPRIKETVPIKSMPIDIFLKYIKDGEWQDETLRIRVIKDKEERQAAKKLVPYVTISGEFSDRQVSGLIRHSGFIAIDLDNLADPEEIKSIVCPDPYVYACFTSISNTGLCVIFKINPDKHLESFLGLQQYLFELAELIVDVTGKDVSRARYVSWDQDIYINEEAKKFTKYLKPEKAQPVKEIVYVQADFDDILRQLVERKVDITGGYREWLKICFALCDKFGEHGRDYFHTLSQFSAKYSPASCDRQYTNCLKAGKSGITIKSFYFLAKEHGILTTSTQTKMIATAAGMAKKGGRSKESIVKTLAEIEGIAPGDSEGIVDQIFDGSEEAEQDDLSTQFKAWLSAEHKMLRNEISDKLENNSLEMTDRELNDIYSEARRQFPKLPKEAMVEILYSNFIRSYHPVKQFFARYEHAAVGGTIDALFGAIDTPTGWPGYAAYFGKKWLVGMLANLFGGDISPLLLVLCGEKVGTGKTRFFKDLLPPELKPYFTVKSLSMISNESARKDLEIAMSKYLLILDDEMSGKSKRDEKAIKALLSSDHSTHRAAFARTEERRVRLCGFCGTSNDLGVIGWDVGPQRRIVPVEVTGIDFKAVNAVSRISLWAEAYALYRANFDYEVLGSDVERLHQATDRFMQVNHEAEAIAAKWSPGQAGGMGCEFLTLTEIKNRLSVGNRDPINPQKIAKALKDMGFDRIDKRANGIKFGGYWVSSPVSPVSPV